MPEIMVYCRNINVRIAEEIGAETQRAYMDKLGLLNRLPLEVLIDQTFIANNS